MTMGRENQAPSEIIQRRAPRALRGLKLSGNQCLIGWGGQAGTRSIRQLSVKREGRRRLGGTGAATVAQDWGESQGATNRILTRFAKCTPAA